MTSYSFQYKAKGKYILIRKEGYNCIKVTGREFVAYVCIEDLASREYQELKHP